MRNNMKRIPNQTTDELITLYIESATEKRIASTSDPRLDHRLYDRMKKIFRELASRGKPDLLQFCMLFHHEDPNIRLAAAAEALWELNEPSAISVLEEIELSQKENLLSLEAEYTIKEWRKRQKGTST